MQNDIFDPKDLFGTVNVLDKGYVDLFLIHASNPNDVMVWHLLREYQKSGKIRNVGISNYNIERLDKFCETIGIEESRMIYATY